MLGWAVGLLLVAVAAALAATYLLRADALSQARSEQVEVGARFPGPVDAGATQAYLAGDGAALLVMHRTAVEQLRAGSGGGSCQERATGLQAVVPADRAYVLVAGVPDEALRAVLGDERAALGQTFTRCADPAVPDAAADLAAAVALADLRLDALGVLR